MRILVVAQDYPWPSNYGSRIRLSNVVRALASVGDVDLFAFTWIATDQSEPPPDGIVKRWQVFPRPKALRRSMQKLGWLVAGGLPSDFLGRDFGAVQAEFARWADPQYDLIWFSRLEPYVTLAHLVEGPKIIDIDDLADWRIKSKGRSPQTDGRPRAGFRAMSQNRIEKLRDRKDMRAWQQLQVRVSGSVSAVVVCSEVDRGRLGVSNAVVVPNGYELPPQPAGELRAAHVPTILLQGTFGYEPNLDAATYLVQEIAPILRASVEDLQVRLVGRAGDATLGLADPPRVVVTGLVPEMEPELRLADVVAVPLRYGSGTRIKILEAFAHKVPVVATSLGAEGLEAVHGQHLLVADAPDEFAAACLRILNDEDLRRSLVAAAHSLFLRKYQWERIRWGIVSLAVTHAAMQPAGSSEYPGGSR